MSDIVESEERRLSDSESDQIWEENIYMSGCNVRSVGGLGGRGLFSTDCSMGFNNSWATLGRVAEP